MREIDITLYKNTTIYTKNFEIKRLDLGHNNQIISNCDEYSTYCFNLIIF